MKDKLLLLISIFLLGFSVLSFELVAIREAGLAFGTTMFALSSVTAFLFGGMALGSWYFTRKILNKPNLKKSIILSEFFYALLSLVSFIILENAGVISSHIFSFATTNFFIQTLIKFLFISVIVVPPSFVAGLFLPEFYAALNGNDSGKVLNTSSLLYGSNTIGSAVGVYCTAFFFVPNIGLRMTIFISVIFVVISMLLTFFASIAQTLESAQDDTKTYGAEDASRGNTTILYMSLAFVSGFVFLSYESIWSRFLALIIHNTVYTYSVTIGFITLGIGIGSVISLPLFKRIKNREYIYSLLLLISVVVSMVLFKLPAKVWLNGMETGESFLGNLYRIMMLVFIPSLIAGILFPALIDLYLKVRSDDSGAVGKIIALNTFGGVMGSILTGFLFIPQFGIFRSFFIVSLLQVISAIVLNFSIFRKITVWRYSISVALVIVWIVAPVAMGTKIPEDYLKTSGRLIDFIEGISSNISVVYKKNMYQLEINRLWQGENVKNRQIMAAHIPMLLHDGDVKKVAVVGLGAGQTGKRFLMYDVDSLFVVDIEAELFPFVKRYFGALWLDDNRVVKVKNDGRNFLQTTNDKFDVISLEVGQMFRPYLASFYTEEFYRIAADHLNNGGLVSQFVPLAAFGKHEFESVIKTFMKVFPHTVLWYNSSEFILLGSLDKEIKFNREKFVKAMSNDSVYKDLEFRYWGGTADNLNDGIVFSAGFIANGSTLDTVIKDAEIYTDNKPTLEYVAARGSETDDYIDSLGKYMTPLKEIFSESVSDTLLDVISQIRKFNIGNIKAEALYSYYDESSNKDINLLKLAERFNSQNIPILAELANYYLTRKELVKALNYYLRISKMDDSNFEVFNNIGLIYLYNKEYYKAEYYLKRAVDLNGKSEKTVKNLANLLVGLKEYNAAIYYYRHLLKLNPSSRVAKSGIQLCYEFIESKNK